MDNQKQTITLSHYDLLYTLQVINAMENAERQRPDGDIIEIDTLACLKLNILRNLENTIEKCMVELTMEQCFSIFLCLDRYLDFCKHTNNNKEKEYCEQLIDKYRPKTT